MAGRAFDPSSMRVGDVDRDHCVDRLQQHFVAGKLEQWEFEDRVEKALVATTAGELDALDADCERERRPSSMTAAKRAGVWLAGLAAIVAVGAVTAAASGGDTALSTCVATGVAVPAGVACPDLTRQQERLMQDADKATAAADQVSALENGTDDARLEALEAKAQAAADRSAEAVTDAQQIVAAAPDGKVGHNSLKAAAKKARTAAADATRAAIAANAIVHHRS